MFSSFMVYSQSSQKPSIFNINKGKVKVISSDENFWIKYPQEVVDQIKISNNACNLNFNICCLSYGCKFKNNTKVLLCRNHIFINLINLKSKHFYKYIRNFLCF